jgi:hypothetical protein
MLREITYIEKCLAFYLRNILFEYRMTNFRFVVERIYLKRSAKKTVVVG